MAKEATMDILFGLQKTAETKIFDFLNPQLYNIEEMDSKDCMISLAFSGCYDFGRRNRPILCPDMVCLCLYSC